MASVAEWLSASVERQVSTELPERSPQVQHLLAALNGCVKHLQAGLMLLSTDILMTRREAVLAQSSSLSSHSKDRLRFAPITHQKLFGNLVGDVIKEEQQDRQLKALSSKSSSSQQKASFKIPLKPKPKSKQKPQSSSNLSQGSSPASSSPVRPSQSPSRGGYQSGPRRGSSGRGGSSRGRLP